MRILWISKYSDGADLALRCKLEGNQVRLHIIDPKYQDCFDGILEKVKTWQGSVAWADLMVFDGNSKESTEIWKKVQNHKPCFGGNAFGPKIEDDRELSHDIMDRMGLKRIESIQVRTVKEAIAHLKTHKVPHVAKPEGKKVEKHHTIIGKFPDNSDVIYLLERFQDLRIPCDSIEIEEKKTGMEVGISGWFNGEDWCYPINVNFEHKHTHPNETGFICGEAGTLLYYHPDQNLPLFKKNLDPIKPWLQKVGYKGQIDLNMILEKGEDGETVAWPLEFTPRLGYPSCFIESELHLTPWSKLFADIAMGKDPNLEVHWDYAVGVMLMSFGFPFPDEFLKASHDMPIFGVEKEGLKNIHLIQAKFSEKKDQFVTAREDGWTLCATGRGDTKGEAKERAYGALDKVYIPNSWWRNDISDKIDEDDLEELGLSLKSAEAV